MSEGSHRPVADFGDAFSGRLHRRRWITTARARPGASVTAYP
ncbi:hypothetical protein SCATT_p10800 (plasmid) [Streptantibioticus cattleyicolor NRRL 8057 = DSM 46488]|uniref:Uncharacterized protein n=1 Tax=Streptantibioticus cattleyicolor (strain ATCC 35852 / DSM 46488 / JCM 4925 / NBRC 14057 / NRRL 8057) TaxID=1003195 RepID=G8XEB9_STREN|nr:hypothetical protein SCATT_p10800 [Streptantibioticus cattleyicolor NRRL 8057 = DSM 46488]